MKSLGLGGAGPLGKVTVNDLNSGDKALVVEVGGGTLETAYEQASGATNLPVNIAATDTNYTFDLVAEIGADGGDELRFAFPVDVMIAYSTVSATAQTRAAAIVSGTAAQNENHEAGVEFRKIPAEYAGETNIYCCIRSDTKLTNSGTGYGFIGLKV